MPRLGEFPAGGKSHPPKVSTVKNHFYQDHHTLPKWTLTKISSFRITTSSQCRNLKISSFKTTMPSQIKNLKIGSFKTITPSQSINCKNSVLSRPPHPPKVEIIKNKFLQDHHTLPEWKLIKISSFKTTKTSQNRNLKISSFKTTTTTQCRNLKYQFFQDQHTLPM